MYGAHVVYDRCNFTVEHILISKSMELNGLYTGPVWKYGSYIRTKNSYIMWFMTCIRNWVHL